LEFLCQTLEALGVLTHGSDVFWKDDVLRRCLTDDFREPSEVGRVPSGPAGVTDIVSQQEGFETELGVLESADGLFPRPREVTDGRIVDPGALDWGEITGTRQPGQWHGVSAVGVDAIPRFCRDQRGGDHPAVIALVRSIPIEPIATGSGCRDEDHMVGLRWHRAAELIDVILAGAEGAEGGDLGTVILSDRGNGNRLFVDIQTDADGGRLGHG